MSSVRSNYRSSTSTPMSVKDITVGSIERKHIRFLDDKKDVRLVTDAYSSKDKRNFQVRLMKYDPKQIRKEIELCRKEIDSPSETKFLDLFFRYRNSYVEEGEQLHLQLSMLAMRLHIFQKFHGADKHRLLIQPEEYFKYSLEFGSAFTEFLKKLRAYATLSTISHVNFIDLDEKIDELNKNIFNITLNKDDKWSYDDFLSESYLLFFEEEVDDYQWAFKPVESDEASLDMFRALIRKILLEHKVAILRDPSHDEIMTWTSDSSSFNSEDPDSKSQPHRTKVRNNARKKDLDPFGRLQDNLTFTRSIIPVGPGNFRDAWMPNLDSLFTIKSISYYMRQIIQTIPYSAMYDENIAYHRKAFLRDESQENLFLLLDFKKSGITINRELLQIMGEELVRAYPGVPALEAISSYQNIKVWNGTSYDYPVRGCGLGNMNELYTLFQCATGEATKLRYGMNSIYYNDDAAIQMHPKKWRQQLGWTMGYLKGLGQIVNLAKTVVSRSNIFCEDYVIHGDVTYDYNKHQLLIMPFAEALLQSTTASAKRYVYSIDRQLIGTGYRYMTAQFLPLASLIYPNEFGKLDQYLPYHLGGWIDFSSTNFSCLFEFILDPKSYITRSEDEGHIPEIRRWVQYNRDQLRTASGLLSTTAKISYRDYVKNSLQSEIVNEFESELGQFIFSYTGLGSTKDYKKMLDGILNFRGLHNAKPKIKFGLALKEAKRRRTFYYEYKLIKLSLKVYPQRSLLDFKLLLQDLKEMDESPTYLSFPRFMVTESEKAPNERGVNTLVINKTEGVVGKPLPLLNRRVIANTIASIDNGYWIENSDPFVLADLWRTCKSGYLNSDKEIRYNRNGIFNTPFMYECFCPNKKLFIAEYQTRTGRTPLSYVPLMVGHREHSMLSYKDAFEHILPVDQIGQWRDIKHLYKKQIFELRVLLSQTTLRGRDQLKAALNSLEDIYQDVIDVVDEELFTLPSGYDHFFNRVDQNIFLDRLISEKLSVEELLEEEDSDFYSDYDSDVAAEDEEVAYVVDKSLDSDTDDEIPYDNESLFSYGGADEYVSDDGQSPIEYRDESSDEEDDLYCLSDTDDVYEGPQYSAFSDEDWMLFDTHFALNDVRYQREGSVKLLFNRFGLGIGAGSLNLRLNVHTFEIWDMNDLHQRSEYVSWRKTHLYFDSEMSDYVEVEGTLNLNEARRLLRNEKQSKLSRY